MTVIGGLALLLLARHAYRFFVHTRSESIEDLLLRTVILAGAGCLLFIRPRYVVAVGHDMVGVIDRRKRRMDQHPLGSVREADVDSWDRLFLELDGKRENLTRLRGGWAEAEQCAEYINALVAESRSWEAG